MAAIAGQSISSSKLFTAYEIRKIIPRLVIGVIAVQLSWYIVAFFVDVFNIIGAGVRGLVLAPVQGLEFSVSFDLANNWTEIATVIGIIGGVSLALAAAAGGILMGIPLILFPLILGLILAFITIVIRRILILMLIVTSPIAFVSWILPNTDAFFKKWWEYFWKALIVYPMIILLISAGELLARVITASNTADATSQISVWSSIIALMAFFAPFFMIPFVFRFAGGVLAEIANGIDKKGKGMNERIFGTKHAEGSWRNRRYKQQIVTRTRQKGRLMSRAGKWQGSNRKLTRGLGLAVGKIGASMGGGIYDKQAMLTEEARAWRDELTGSARDEEIYALLGDNQIISGRKLSDEAIAAVALARNNPYKVQAALDYALTKAEDDEARERVFRRFMHGEKDNTGKTINFSGGLKDYEKHAAFDRTADKYQGEYGHLKYLDPDTGLLTKDESKLSRFATELNNRKSSYFDLAEQRAPMWRSVGQLSQTAHNIYNQAGGDSNFNADSLNTNQRNILRELRAVREGLGDITPSGGTPAANIERGKTVDGMKWLDNPNLRGL